MEKCCLLLLFLSRKRLAPPEPSQVAHPFIVCLWSFSAPLIITNRSPPFARGKKEGKKAPLNGFSSALSTWLCVCVCLSIQAHNFSSIRKWAKRGISLVNDGNKENENRKAIASRWLNSYSNFIDCVTSWGSTVEHNSTPHPCSIALCTLRHCYNLMRFFLFSLHSVLWFHLIEFFLSLLMAHEKFRLPLPWGGFERRGDEKCSLVFDDLW